MTGAHLGQSHGTTCRTPKRENICLSWNGSSHSYKVCCWQCRRAVFPTMNWTLYSSPPRNLSRRWGHTGTPSRGHEPEAVAELPSCRQAGLWLRGWEQGTKNHSELRLVSTSPSGGQEEGGGRGGGQEAAMLQWVTGDDTQLEALSNKWRPIYPPTTRDGCSQGWNQGGQHKVSGELHGPGPGAVTVWEGSFLAHIGTKDFKLYDIRPDI